MARGNATRLAQFRRRHPPALDTPTPTACLNDAQLLAPSRRQMARRSRKVIVPVASCSEWQIRHDDGVAYVLEALLVTRIGLAIAAIDVYPSVAVPLGAIPNLALVPITKSVRRAMSSGSGEPILGFYALTEGIAQWAQRLSRDGAAAYVHAEHAGGPGFQAAIGWRAGLVGIGPIFTQDQDGEAEDWYSVPADRRTGLAINEALRCWGSREVAGLTRWWGSDVTAPLRNGQQPTVARGDHEPSPLTGQPSLAGSIEPPAPSWHTKRRHQATVLRPDHGATSTAGAHPQTRWSRQWRARTASGTASYPAIEGYLRLVDKPHVLGHPRLIAAADRVAESVRN